MKTTEKVEIYTCDAPECGTEIYIRDNDMPDGYHGTVMEIGSFGGTGNAQWFACKSAHIKDAVLHALIRETEALR